MYFYTPPFRPLTLRGSLGNLGSAKTVRSKKKFYFFARYPTYFHASTSAAHERTQPAQRYSATTHELCPLG